MSEITKRRSGQLVRGVFEILLPLSDGLQVKEILKRLETVVPPSDFEKTYYPSNPEVRRYENIVRFSTITFVKAGWLTKGRGQWTLTDDGRRAYQQFADPEQFMQESIRLYKNWENKQPPTDEETVAPTITTDRPAAVTVEESEERAWNEINAHLAEMSPYDFQDLVAGLLRGMQYHVSWVAPPGADGGLDIVAHADPLGISGPRIKVQVKRRPDDRTGVEGIRSFLSNLGEGDVGLFVASGGFSKEAEMEARRQERRRIMLVDLDRLFDLWVEHYDRIPEAQRRLLPLKKVYFLDTED